jgi:transcription antitermination factor NusG
VSAPSLGKVGGHPDLSAVNVRVAYAMGNAIEISLSEVMTLDRQPILRLVLLGDLAPGLRKKSIPFMKTGDERFLTLNDRDMGLIRTAEQKANRHMQFEVGDRVRVIEGPFADRLAVIQRLDDESRIKLLLDIFGKLYVSPNQIEPAA